MRLSAERIGAAINECEWESEVAYVAHPAGTHRALRDQIATRCAPAIGLATYRAIEADAAAEPAVLAREMGPAMASDDASRSLRRHPTTCNGYGVKIGQSQRAPGDAAGFHPPGVNAGYRRGEYRLGRRQHRRRPVSTARLVRRPPGLSAESGRRRRRRRQAIRQRPVVRRAREGGLAHAQADDPADGAAAPPNTFAASRPGELDAPALMPARRLAAPAARPTGLRPSARHAPGRR